MKQPAKKIEMTISSLMIEPNLCDRPFSKGQTSVVTLPEKSREYSFGYLVIVQSQDLSATLRYLSCILHDDSKYSKLYINWDRI